MVENRTKIDNKETFRAHIWSPLNKGEAILEISIGTTVEELLDTLSQLWGARFKPERGFAYRRGYIAGWCVLCKSTSGIFYPLGISDTIPARPIEHEVPHHFPYHFIDPSHWFWQTDKRLKNTIGLRKVRDDSFVKEADIEESLTNTKKSAVRGIIYTGPSGFIRDPELQALISGPEPKENVDVRLAVIIAVSGT